MIGILTPDDQNEIDQALSQERDEPRLLRSYTATEQPPVVEWLTVDALFIKQIHIAKAGTLVPQHSHKYDHTSMLARGSIKLWQDGVYLGEFAAPRPIFIRAGTKHLFRALEDNTLIYCIHNATRPDVAAVLEEHQLVGEF